MTINVSEMPIGSNKLNFNSIILHSRSNLIKRFILAKLNLIIKLVVVRSSARIYEI